MTWVSSIGVVDMLLCWLLGVGNENRLLLRIGLLIKSSGNLSTCCFVRVELSRSSRKVS